MSASLAVLALLVVSGADRTEERKVLLLDAVPLSDAVSLKDTQLLEALLADRLRQQPHLSLLRAEPLVNEPQKMRPEALVKVRALVRKGEDSYLNFQFTAAAAAMGEAAGLLVGSMGTLDASALALLQHVRILEGSAWAEAKMADLAINAFVELQSLMPQAKLDKKIVTPRVLALWQVATSRVRSRGTASLRVISEPTDAEVLVDGQPRGRTPLAPLQLAKGVHYLTVHLQGMEASTATLQLDGDREWRVALQESSLSASRRNLQAKLRRGAAPTAAQDADLQALQQASGADAVIIAGLGRAGSSEVALLTRWQSQGARPQRVVVIDHGALTQWLPQAVAALLEPGAGTRTFPDGLVAPLNFDRALMGWPPADAPPAAAAASAPTAVQASLSSPSAGSAESATPLAPWRPTLSLWGGAGTPTLAGFGVQGSLALEHGWSSGPWTLAAQLSWAHSVLARRATFDQAGAGVVLLAQAVLGDWRVGGGLKASALAHFQRAVADGLRVQVGPQGAAILRVQVTLVKGLSVGAQGIAGVEGFAVAKGSGARWVWPWVFAGQVGLTWTFSSPGVAS